MPDADIVPLNKARDSKAKRKSAAPTAGMTPAEKRARRSERYRATQAVVIPGWTAKQPNKHGKNDVTRTTVRLMTGYGATQAQIAEALNISPRTLWERYREEISTGHHQANMAVVGNLFRLATDPEGTNATVQAAIWWTKARMGWAETRLISADVRKVTLQARELSDDELAEIIRRDPGRAERLSHGRNGGAGALLEEESPGEFLRVGPPDGR